MAPVRFRRGARWRGRPVRTNSERVAHRDDLIGEVEAAFADNGAEHWLAALAEAGVPAGKVRTLDDVYAWEQTRSQHLLLEVDHATLGRVTLPGPPLRFDPDEVSGPLVGGRAEHLAPPLLGEHDESVRAWLDETEAGGR